MILNLKKNHDYFNYACMRHGFINTTQTGTHAEFQIGMHDISTLDRDSF